MRKLALLIALTAVLSATMAAALAAGAAHAAEAAARPYKVPRTRDGQPDLQGTWTNSSLTFLARPPIFKALIATEAEEKAMLAGFKQMAGDLISTDPIDPNKPAPPIVKAAPNSDFIEMDLHLARIDGQMRSSWIVEPANGQVPLTDAGRAALKALEVGNDYRGPEVRPLTERCLLGIGMPEGPPMMNTGFNAHYKIVQGRHAIAIYVEMNHDVRIIRLGDRTHAPAAVRPWMGDSVGWWEGDTLVVETTNFDPRRAYVASLTGGFAFSAGGRLIERFTRTSKDRILYRFEVDDPAHFKSVWKAEMPMRATDAAIYEYACHEGNYSLGNALSGARAEEARAAAAKP